MKKYFTLSTPAAYIGPDAPATAVGYRFYRPDHQINGHPLEKWMPMGVCGWHHGQGTGGDPFGPGAGSRPWPTNPASIAEAGERFDAVIELATLTGCRFLQFHDADFTYGWGNDPVANRDKVMEMVALANPKLAAAGKEIGWFTGNFFSPAYYKDGASISPRFDIFAFAAAQAKTVVDAAVALGAKDIVRWGGREGMPALPFNRKIGQDLAAHLAFYKMTVGYAKKAGLKGKVLDEPKPKEPSEHQLVRDVQTLWANVQQAGLSVKDVGANIELGHAEMGGEPFWYQIALAREYGLLHGVDLNDQHYLSGWDTDHIAVGNLMKLVPACWIMIESGQPISGVFNHDAKLRRTSTSHDDLVTSIVGANDNLALAFMVAEQLRLDGGIAEFLSGAYVGWDDALARKVLAGEASLEEVAAMANVVTTPASSKEEELTAYMTRALAKVIRAL